MIYRIATSGDINDVFNIETQCFLTPWTTNLIASELEKPDYVAFAAVDNGKVCGYVFASCVLSEGEIERIAVTENMRRKGIGDELMRLAIEKLALSGVEKVFLEVRSDNYKAINLYKKHGFLTVGIRKKYCENTKDALIMNLKL